jgi:hypothetical protein
MVMGDLVLKGVRDNSFGLSPYLKRVQGQSRAIIGIDVGSDK